jgi:Xaa-Pro aminopeptidase
LYIQGSKVEQIKEYLDSQNISTKEYEEVEVDLKQWADAVDSKIGVHKSTCNAKMLGLIKEIAVDTADNITQHAKAAKNVTEQAGMRACNVRDCAAIMKYFAYLEEELQKDDHDVTEYTGARYLDNLRTKGQYHQGPSFDTISSIGANGAVIHYKPDEDTAVKLNRDEIYLLDSGGQYLDGTTDITRTTHFGGKEPT